MDSKITTDELDNNLYIGYGKLISRNISNDHKVMQFVPYNYVNSKDVIRIIRKMGITAKQVKFFQYFGMQLIVGKAEEIRKVLKIINLLDRPYLEKKIPYIVEKSNTFYSCLS